jgi:drug/metabolite transporter (DMT)-like permease
MFAAVLTTFFFALSAILARRSIVHLGSQRANFSRQALALFLLGLYAHFFGQGMTGPTFGLFFLSGVLGFGLGDWALFEALPRIGAGLTLLLCQCLAAPIAAVTERVFLGTQMTAVQLSSSALILAGVALALAPGKNETIPIGHRALGILFGFGAALGQAWGAVLSRFAFQRAHHAGFSIDGLSSAYQRLLGGILTIGLLILLRGYPTRWRGLNKEEIASGWRKAWPWVTANAVVGPVLGVGCYQWALKSEPSSIVLPIVATSPLAAMLLAFAGEGSQPSRRAIAGSLLAVFGVIMLVRNS